MLKFIKNLFIFLILFQISCTKDKADYRLKYIGKYDFTTFIFIWWPPACIFYNDTIRYAGNLTNGPGDSDIVIQYTPEHSFLIHSCNPDTENIEMYPPGIIKSVLKEDGTFGYKIDGNNFCEGKFETGQKVSFIMRSGGNGGGGRDNVTGIKIN